MTTHPGIAALAGPLFSFAGKRAEEMLFLQASLRGTKQSPTYRAALYSIEIASCLAMTLGKEESLFPAKLKRG
jgi:hypothetical protein